MKGLQARVRRQQRAHLYAHVADKVSGDGVSCALVHNLHADVGAAFGLQGIPRQVLTGKCGLAAPVRRLPAELTVGILAPKAPASARNELSHRETA